MSNQANGGLVSSSHSPRKLKILMLHGYTQSGPLFHSKTRALEKLLHKAFPAAPSPSTTSKPTKTTSTHHALYPGGVELLYATAPLALNPADIPGFTPSDLDGNTPTEGNGEAEQTAFGWWKRETGSGLYFGLGESLSQIAALIRECGGVDGVLGFSQGGCFAALLASLLEPRREEAFAASLNTNPDALPFPPEWADLKKDFYPNKGLQFAAIYAGFYAPHPAYAGFYKPKIGTRTVHFVGSLDTVVEESRVMALVDSTVLREDGGGSVVVRHPGGHFVPVGKEMGGVLVGFVRDCLVEKKKEGGVEDMDVPF